MPAADPGTLALVAYDGLRPFEYAIAVEVFALERPGLGVPWYRCIVVSPDAGPRGRVAADRGLGGVVVQPSARWEAIDQARTIVLAGWRDVESPAPPKLLRALRAAHERGARLLSICSGAFPLAEAGLLDGRRATTHWLWAEAFRRRFPRVQYEGDVLYVDEGAVITSAGSGAGVDACLHLVRRDFGVRVANRVARRMVVPPHREGGQAQYVEAPVAPRPARSLGLAMDWVRERLHEPVSVADWMRQTAMSPRTFLRRFRAATGLTPLEWLQRERTARARELLERGTLPLADVAEACGYASAETFRAAFRRHAGVAPARYRDRFASRR